jgi:hypothetical protein
MSFLFAISAELRAGDSFPFEKYPARVTRRKPSQPILTTPLARQHRSVIRKAVRDGVNFAGHYTVVEWGCGTSCAVLVIVDARSGRVYEPSQISKGIDLRVAAPEYRPNSTLMVVPSCESKNCERKLYDWNGSRLILVETEPIASSPPQ